MTAPEERTRAFAEALIDDGIPIVEDVAEDTAVVEASQLQHLRAEATPPPRTPPPPPPPVVESSEYERALSDVRAVLLEVIAMPPQAVDLYLELARKRGRRA